MAGCTGEPRSNKALVVAVNRPTWKVVAVTAFALPRRRCSRTWMHPDNRLLRHDTR